MCAHGAGKRYLVQHSAGSGKSNSIAWLSHQLIGVKRRQGGVRLGDRGHRPAHPRRPDSEDHQAVHAGGRDGGPRRALGRPAQVHRAGQEDHRLDGAEVPLHPRRDRHRGRQDLRHRHRRGAFQPGRQDLGGDEQGAGRRGGGRGRGDRPRRHGERRARKAHGGAQDADQRQLLRLHRHAQEQDAGDVRRGAAARRRGQGQAPALSTATR